MFPRRRRPYQLIPALKFAGYLLVSAGSVAGLVCFVIFYFIPKFAEYRTRQDARTKLVDDVARERSKLKHYEWQTERFSTDPEFVELIARNMGMARTNESVCKLVDGIPDRTNIAHAGVQQAKTSPAATASDAGRRAKAQSRTKR